VTAFLLDLDGTTVHFGTNKLIDGKLEESEAWLELYASSADPEGLLEHDHSMDG
jgi:hypothetical protein